MGINIGFVSLGCSKNQVDAEIMLSDMSSQGFSLCADPAECDAVVINTCGFIEDAKRESIEQIFSFASRKGTGRLRVVAVTGCLAERYRQELADEMPEVDVVLGIGKNADIVPAIRRALEGDRVVEFGPKEALALGGERVLIGPSYSAYVKVAEGCDNRCAFCAIPDIRGPFRSRPMEDIVAEMGALAARGVKEINIVAQDTTRYGQDLYGRLMLPELLRAACRVEGVRWVRLLYCYPDRVTDELIETIATEPKIVKYIDLPLQHIDDRLLRRMRRRGDRALIEGLIAKLRRRIPGVVIRTTMIAGLPGEGEEEFAALCDFVWQTGFERLGCFAYSPEEGTQAAGMEGQVEPETARRRADLLMEMQMDIARRFARGLMGRSLSVLCEGFDRERGMFAGRSYMDAPDIDTRVYFTAEKPPAPGEFCLVRIDEADGYDVTGVRLEEETET
jgi:ribosomal protein S12 methylthiotransferase